MPKSLTGLHDGTPCLNIDKISIQNYFKENCVLIVYNVVKYIKVTAYYQI